MDRLAALEQIRIVVGKVLGQQVPDVGPDTKLLEELNKKLYANGLQKVIDEAQKQYDAWKATQGK